MLKKFTIYIVSILLIIIFITGCSKDKIEDNVFKIALGGRQPTSIDPSSNSSVDFLNGNVCEALVYFNEKGEITPRLAVSWTLSEDFKEITMKLRKDVKFSSGELFTSKDVDFSLNRNRKTNMVIDAMIDDSFERMEALDDHTVKFIFKRPNSQFLYQVCSMLYIISEEDYNKMGEKEFAKQPIGTGQYKVTEWVAGQYVQLEENKNYWGNEPQIKKAKFILSPDVNTRINMLRSGEVDMITHVNWEAIESLKKSGFNIKIVDCPYSIAITFGLINKNTPWADLRVRKAIKYCIDKDEIISKLCYGIPEKVDWLLDWELGYNTSLNSSYEYNPIKAKELMIEAGYPDGFEMPVIYTPNVANLKNIIDYLTNTLKQIGIECKIVGLNFGPEFFGKIKTLHEDQNAVAIAIWEIGGPGNPDPIINLTNNYYSEKNSSLYNTPELDKIIKMGLAAVDNNERKKLIQKAYKIVDDDLPIIHIYRQAYVFVSKNGIIYEPSYCTQSSFSFLGDIKLTN